MIMTVRKKMMTIHTSICFNNSQIKSSITLAAKPLISSNHRLVRRFHGINACTARRAVQCQPTFQQHRHHKRRFIQTTLPSLFRQQEEVKHEYEHDSTDTSAGVRNVDLDVDATHNKARTAGKKGKVDAVSKSNSSTSTSKTTSTTPLSSTILYKRNSSKTLFPRALLSLSTIHTGYWIWYVTDFTPFVQGQIAALESSAASVAAATTSVTTTALVDLDTTIGYLGLGLAIFMQIGSLLYPTSLIQEIQLLHPNDDDDSNNINESILLDPSSTMVQISTYSLPFITPSTAPTQYKLGAMTIDSPNDVKEIITEYESDLRLYNGYIPLHAPKRYINLLLHLQEQKSSKNDDDDDDDEKEIFHHELLFHSLVSPKLHSAIGGRGRGNMKSVHNNDHARGSDNKGIHGQNTDIMLKRQKRKERQMQRKKR